MSNTPANAGQFVTIATVSEMSEQHGPGIRRLAHAEIALFKLDEQYYALDGRCPHRGGSLGAGTVENGTVFCPMHGWQFDIKTGACLDHPERPARCLPVRVVDGQIQVQL